MGAWGYLPSQSDGGLDEWSDKLSTLISSKKTYTQWWNEKIPTLAKLQGGKGKRAWTYDDHLNSYYVFFDIGMNKKRLKEGIKWREEEIDELEAENPRSKAQKRLRTTTLNRYKKEKQALEIILKKGIPKSASKKAGLILAKAIVKYDAHDGFSGWRSPSSRKSALVKLAKKLGAPVSAFKPITKKKAPAKKKTTTKRKASPVRKKLSQRKKAPKKSARILRGKRNSPSTSATSVSVGTKRRGGDGKMYVCKTYKRGNKRVKRWFKV
jgi:hypothetical protein